MPTIFEHFNLEFQPSGSKEDENIQLAAKTFWIYCATQEQSVLPAWFASCFQIGCVDRQVFYSSLVTTRGKRLVYLLFHPCPPSHTFCHSLFPSMKFFCKMTLRREQWWLLFPMGVAAAARGAASVQCCVYWQCLHGSLAYRSKGDEKERREELVHDHDFFMRNKT